MFIYIHIKLYYIIGKTNDKGKVVQSEMALQRFGLKPESALPTRLPWILTKTELQSACHRLTHVVIPAHYDFNPQYLFTYPYRLKSHDWKQVCVPRNVFGYPCLMLFVNLDSLPRCP